MASVGGMCEERKGGGGRDRQTVEGVRSGVEELQVFNLGVVPGNVGANTVGTAMIVGGRGGRVWWRIC